MQTFVKHLGYKKASSSGGKSLKAHVKYMERRKNEQGEKEKREIFSNSDNIDRIKFYNEMDKIKNGVLGHKLVISMDGKTREEQNIDFKELTRRTMSKFEQKQNKKLNWVSCIHEGKNPHAHIVILGKDSNGKSVNIMPKDLNNIKRMADKEREIIYKRNIERDKTQKKRIINIDKQLEHEQKIEFKSNFRAGINIKQEKTIDRGNIERGR